MILCFIEFIELRREGCLKPHPQDHIKIDKDAQLIIWHQLMITVYQMSDHNSGQTVGVNLAVMETIQSVHRLIIVFSSAYTAT